MFKKLLADISRRLCHLEVESYEAAEEMLEGPCGLAVPGKLDILVFTVLRSFINTCRVSSALRAHTNPNRASRLITFNWNNEFIPSFLMHSSEKRTLFNRTSATLRSRAAVAIDFPVRTCFLKLGLTTETAEEQRREINTILYKSGVSPAGTHLNTHRNTHTHTLPSRGIQQLVKVLSALFKCHQVALKLALGKTLVSSSISSSPRSS